MENEARIDHKRKRSTFTNSSENENGSPEVESRHGDDNGKPVKRRACNECRQQKLRCDVIQHPFAACARCRRLNLECRIEPNFRRVAKRTENAEMQREIVELRRLHASSLKQDTTRGSFSPVPKQAEHYSPPLQMSGVEQYKPPNQPTLRPITPAPQDIEPANSLEPSTTDEMFGSQFIGSVTLSGDRIAHLFYLFFIHYHPFLPLLRHDHTPAQYFAQSPLLAWTVILIASRRFPPDPLLFESLSGPFMSLLWSTLAEVPQSYHVVQALCLFCTWPIPTSNSLNDPVFMLTGLMMQTALQQGLHQPHNAQDFMRQKVELGEAVIQDRVTTWAACNIVAQSVSTGNGQPPIVRYNRMLQSLSSKQSEYKIPDELRVRLQIENFCNNVTKGLYINAPNKYEAGDAAEKATMVSVLAREFQAMEIEFGSRLSPINHLHLRAAEIHLRYSAFFDAETASTYQKGLISGYYATKSFLACALSLKSTPDLIYSGGYILQMVVSAAFALLKLLNSSFSSHVDLESGKKLFNQTLDAIKGVSVKSNDRAMRLAEVLTRLWTAAGKGEAISPGRETDSSLQMKVRCRMSMSHVYDSVWRWREFRDRGRKPTSKRQDATADTSINSVAVDPAILPNTQDIQIGDFVPPQLDGVGDNGMMDIDWMLDGLADFPYEWDPQ
ncbi:Zn(II)2Cys6 transcriptional activator [Phlyctema vagabunda]|uniref:Zn(II)2Cys6 transcriptional activator n=1 Tax=Phlyctema vagabunda TaxID=108571 RepID=A0ABR4PI68_9HELO